MNAIQNLYNIFPHKIYVEYDIYQYLPQSKHS